MTTAPPQFVRIKRKRGQDPLQALILENLQQAKRSKPSSPSASRVSLPAPKSWYFHLSGTDESADPSTLLSVLSESTSSAEQRRFVIPKRSHEDTDAPISNELAEMLDQFLNVEDVPEKRKKRRLNRHATEEEKTDTQEAEREEQAEYVFDVYKLSSTKPLTSGNYPLSLIGYIRFFDDEEFALLQSDDENASISRVLSDDEDSNAESFYQNDYPEDEDAGELSETYESSDDENIGPVIVDNAEEAEGQAYLLGHVQADLAENLFEELYDEFFDENGEQRVDFLEQSGDYEQEDAESFERHKFFEDDGDNPLAEHRDRIFGKLLRMINEA